MTGPNFDRLEALPAPEVAALFVEGEGHALTCLLAFHTGAAVRYFLPPALTPALLPLPSGKHLLFLPDWTDPEACAYSVPAALLPEVRRLLDLRPVFLSPEEMPGPDSRFALEKWDCVPWYFPTAYGRDLFGRSVVPALPPFRRTVRSGKGGQK